MRDNEFDNNESDDGESHELSPYELFSVDIDPPVTVLAVKMVWAEREGQSPEREWRITSGTMGFGFHFFLCENLHD